MKILKIILVTFFLLAILAAALAAWIIYYPKSEKTKESMMRVAISSQAGYFCKVAYPKFGQCVKFDMDQCTAIVAEHISPCMHKALNDIPTLQESDQHSLYNAINQCISPNLQQQLMRKYLKDTPECKDILKQYDN